jgi:hypothetical protein
LLDEEMEPVVIECQETQQQFEVAICDRCLVEADRDPYLLTNFVESKMEAEFERSKLQ